MVGREEGTNTIAYEDREDAGTAYPASQCVSYDIMTLSCTSNCSSAPEDVLDEERHLQEEGERRRKERALWKSSSKRHNFRRRRWSTNKPR